MYSHEEMLRYIIEELNPVHLQDIIEINKMKLNGFRKNSKNTKVKVLKMRNLLKKNKELEYLLEKFIKYYEDNHKIEYVWALPDQLDQKQIEKKITPTNKSNIILELFAAKKYGNIINMISQDREEIIDDVVIKEKEDVQVKLIPSNQDSVEKIRKLLIKSEERYRKLEEKRNTELEELKQREKGFNNLNNKYSILRQEMEEKNDAIEQTKKKHELLISRINELEIEVEKQALDIDLVKKYKVAILGGKSYEKHVTYLLDSISALSYQYYGEEDFQCIDENEYFDSVWVTRFSLNRKEFLEVRNTEVFRTYMGIGKCFTFENTDTLYKFIDKVREFYE